MLWHISKLTGRFEQYLLFCISDLALYLVLLPFCLYTNYLPQKETCIPTLNCIHQSGFADLPCLL